MNLKYYLQPNHITPDPNDQTARVATNNVLRIDNLVKRIVKRGTTLTETDIRAVLRLSFEKAADCIAEGNLAKGMYLVSIITESGKQTQKVVVE